MPIYPSSMPVFDFYRDDDGVYVCELTPGMITTLHRVLQDAAAMAHEKGRWIPSPCVALTKQLENAVAELKRRGPPGLRA